jgi:hypothetical protein
VGLEGVALGGVEGAQDVDFDVEAVRAGHDALPSSRTPGSPE